MGYRKGANEYTYFIKKIIAWIPPDYWDDVACADRYSGVYVFKTRNSDDRWCVAVSFLSIFNGRVAASYALSRSPDVTIKFIADRAVIFHGPAIGIFVRKESKPCGARWRISWEFASNRMTSSARSKIEKINRFTVLLKVCVKRLQTGFKMSKTGDQKVQSKN